MIDAPDDSIYNFQFCLARNGANLFFFSLFPQETYDEEFSKLH